MIDDTGDLHVLKSPVVNLKNQKNLSFQWEQQNISCWTSWEGSRVVYFQIKGPDFSLVSIMEPCFCVYFELWLSFSVGKQNHDAWPHVSCRQTEHFLSWIHLFHQFLRVTARDNHNSGRGVCRLNGPHGNQRREGEVRQPKKARWNCEISLDFTGFTFPSDWP